MPIWYTELVKWVVVTYFIAEAILLFGRFTGYVPKVRSREYYLVNSIGAVFIAVVIALLWKVK